jgi:hypothetical protein
MSTPQPVSTTDAVWVGPYKFLDYYLEADASRFGGRENDIAEVLARITRERTFLLYGRSGLGKTSLLLAGVFPLLKERGYQTVYVRLLQSPVQDLHRAIAAVCPPTVSPDERDTAGLLRALSSQGPVVLVLDQFEEFFIRFKDRPQERADFIRLLGTLLGDNSLDIRIVFSLREDYIAQLNDLRSEWPKLFANEYRLLPLTAFGTRQTIIRPLLAAGIDYDPRLVTALVDLLATVDFDPSLLQIICTEVYREAEKRSQGQPHLIPEDLEQVGGLEGIFRRYLDAALQAIPDEYHLLVRVILDALITQERTKRAINLEFFLGCDFIAGREEIQSVLDILVRQRLVRAEQRGDDRWYELIHERLVDIILNWLALDPDFFNFRIAKELIVNCSRGEVWRKQPETLLNKGQLEGVVGPFREHLRLTDTELEFLVRSAAYRRSEQVQYWAKAYGFGKSASVLLLLLDNDNDEVRLGSARSAGYLSEPDVKDKLADACLTHALEDASEPVRRAAGYSLAALAGQPQEDRLRQALVNRSTCQPALEILADFHKAGKSLDDFTPIQRRRARRIAERRLHRENRVAIMERGNIGALSGLVGGFVWTFTVGVVFASLLLGVTANFENSLTLWSESLFTLLIFTLIITLSFGTLIGWRGAITAAKDAVVYNSEGRWFRSITGTTTVYSLLALMASVTFFILLRAVRFPVLVDLRNYLDNFPFIFRALIYLILSLIVGILCSVPLSLVIASLARLNRPCTWFASTRIEILLWSLLASIGLPLLLPALIWTDIYELWPQLGSIMVLIAVTISFTSFIFTLSLTLSSKVSLHIRSSERNSKWSYRAVTVFFALATVFWFHKYYGFDNSPLWPNIYSLPACTPEGARSSLQVVLGPGWPNTAYFQISPSKDINELTILKTSNDNDANLQLLLNRFPIGHTFHTFVFGPTTLAELVISNIESSPSWGIHEYNISFKSYCLPEVASVIKQIDDTMMIAGFTLKKVSGSNNLFEGTLNGKLKKQKSKDISVLVRLFRNQPQFKHPFNKATVPGFDKSVISFDSQLLEVGSEEKDIFLERYPFESALGLERIVPVENDGQWHQTLSLTMKTDDELLKIKNASELPDEVKIIVGLQVIPTPPK